MADIPTTTIFSIIFALFGFFALFAVATSITVYYRRKESRHLERLELVQRATEDRETIPLRAHRPKKPVISEVQVDGYLNPAATKWEVLFVGFRFTTASVPIHSGPIYYDLIRNFGSASQHDVRSRSILDSCTIASPESVATGSKDQRRRVGIHRRGYRPPDETAGIQWDRYHRLQRFLFHCHAHLP